MSVPRHDLLAVSQRTSARRGFGRDALFGEVLARIADGSLGSADPVALSREGANVRLGLFRPRYVRYATVEPRCS